MEKLPVLACALLCAVLPGLQTDAHAAEAQPLDYFIIVTGGELIEGAYPDGHTHFITRTLRPLGVRCIGSLIVDDRRADMLRALSFATNHAALVLVTGGLGPTPNDITRETLSEFTGIPLRENEEVLAGMEKRFGQPRDQLRANLRKQCLVPERGRFLKNGSGSAVGLVFDCRGTTIVALPGPPRELQPMVRGEVVALLQERFGVRQPGSSITLRFVGVGQSQIAQTLQDQVKLPADVIVTSLFEGGRVDFTFTAAGHSDSELARLKQIEVELRRQLDEFFYADDGSTLEQVVLRELARRGSMLSLAEVASGGALSASLSTTKEARDVVTGAFAAPTAELLMKVVEVPADRWRQATSAEDQAKALAEAAAAHADADWGMALGEARVEGNAAAVWLAIKAGDRWATQRLTVRGTDELDGASLVTPALDRLRRLLKETR